MKTKSSIERMVELGFLDKSYLEKNKFSTVIELNIDELKSIFCRPSNKEEQGEPEEISFLDRVYRYIFQGIDTFTTLEYMTTGTIPAQKIRVEKREKITATEVNKLVWEPSDGIVISCKELILENNTYIEIKDKVTEIEADKLIRQGIPPGSRKDINILGSDGSAGVSGRDGTNGKNGNKGTTKNTGNTGNPGNPGSSGNSGNTGNMNLPCSISIMELIIQEVNGRKIDKLTILSRSGKGGIGGNGGNGGKGGDGGEGGDGTGCSDGAKGGKGGNGGNGGDGGDGGKGGQSNVQITLFVPEKIKNNFLPVVEKSSGGEGGKGGDGSKGGNGGIGGEGHGTGSRGPGGDSGSKGESGGSGKKEDDGSSAKIVIETF